MKTIISLSPVSKLGKIVVKKTGRYHLFNAFLQSLYILKQQHTDISVKRCADLTLDKIKIIGHRAPEERGVGG